MKWLTDSRLEYCWQETTIDKKKEAHPFVLLPNHFIVCIALDSKDLVEVAFGPLYPVVTWEEIFLSRRQCERRERLSRLKEEGSSYAYRRQHTDHIHITWWQSPHAPLCTQQASLCPEICSSWFTVSCWDSTVVVSVWCHVFYLVMWLHSHTRRQTCTGILVQTLTWLHDVSVHRHLDP